jgi:hypothetical protein
MNSRSIIAAALLAFAAPAAGVTACKTVAACLEGSNTGTGAGVTGVSSGSSGLLGETTFASSGASNAKYGVYGRDLSKSGTNDAGVAGTSSRGTGVVGSSTTGIGMSASSTKGTSALTATSNAANAETIRSSDESAAGGISVNAISSNGIGLQASTSGSGNADFGVYAENFSSNANSAAVYAFTNGAAAFRSSGFFVDGFGNINTTGEVYTSGTCSSGCVRRRVKSYAPKDASPTIEDAGEAQLRGGAVWVPLDPAFANVIDPQQRYIVLITPEGDTRGLYVARRTGAGFSVRETMGGRSGIPFAYRIVAHPLGAHEPRLPFVPVDGR